MKVIPHDAVAEDIQAAKGGLLAQHLNKHLFRSLIHQVLATSHAAHDMIVATLALH